MQVPKIVLIGDAKVGKTTYSNSFMGERKAPQFEAYRKKFGEEAHRQLMAKMKVIDKLGMMINPIPLGGKIFNLWTCYEIKDDYFKGVSAFFIMFDLSLESSYDSMISLYERINMTYHVPIVVIGNKKDICHPSNYSLIEIMSECGITYVEISTKEKINLEIPFSYLA